MKTIVPEGETEKGPEDLHYVVYWKGRSKIYVSIYFGQITHLI